MKNRFWGTDILLFTLVLVTAAFAAVIAVTRPDLVVVCILGVCVSSVAVLFNAHAVRKIIRGVFFGYGKQSARQHQPLHDSRQGDTWRQNMAQHL